ncbi:transposase [Planomonospora sp. ID91781]|uniref:transposase n=1 Tax=Planomonospora sp. ID91781 TaxID=2738135 RepID=UPI0018C3E357|nr:transposase [Planomonospora sp. ID91781]MBG0824767.1 transposase [Planomonospora sp. ID91781]
MARTLPPVQAIVTEYDTWCRRDLSGIELDYLFVDASHFKMHDGQRAEPVLPAWGITVDGKPVFVGLAPAAAESTDAWHDFLTDLAARGLRPPLLVVSDGAPGLITACVSLVWAVLDRAARGWRGFTMTSKGLRTLQDLRRALLAPPIRLRPTTVPATDSTPETAAA